MEKSFSAHAAPGTIRAILIDPVELTITEGWQTTGLKALYETLGCDCIDIRGIGVDPKGNPVDMICDDNGRLIDGQRCFRMGSEIFAGRVLLVSHDDEGETTASGLPLHDVGRVVQWCAPETDYTPLPMVVTSFESFDEIAKYLGG